MGRHENKEKGQVQGTNLGIEKENWAYRREQCTNGGCSTISY